VVPAGGAVTLQLGVAQEAGKPEVEVAAMQVIILQVRFQTGGPAGASSAAAVRAAAVTSDTGDDTARADSSRSSAAPEVEGEEQQQEDVAEDLEDPEEPEEEEQQAAPAANGAPSSMPTTTTTSSSSSSGSDSGSGVGGFVSSWWQSVVAAAWSTLQDLQRRAADAFDWSNPATAGAAGAGAAGATATDMGVPPHPSRKLLLTDAAVRQLHQEQQQQGPGRNLAQQQVPGCAPGYVQGVGPIELGKWVTLPTPQQVTLKELQPGGYSVAVRAMDEQGQLGAPSPSYIIRVSG
jgi:hypothetical protein